ncbi:zinc-binding alcohol dehydrogenase family protein [Pengzhenrongella sicca]|uniref:Zinc-binding alcohol dehydrogenase family protein n=1 Tax=Pengzhenrongella sicca TaxID=2819238 RepID=A0A8A4ZFQ2_9MICO|nr:zinc-binding alcohol dehydrogenase family protein [Pengzhenrongella sicca]QTE29366.1 zinc-binding alcohol dehydrogenase family protein [Pengzhenrongella sicca]
MPNNTAAWLNRKHGRLEVAPAPYTTPGPNEIAVRNAAVAINSLDWIIQVEGNLLYGWLKYPMVIGSDVAGEVVEIGSSVTRFQVGDRVLGHAVSSDRDSNRPADGGFQLYTVLLERMASPIPDSLSFPDAATLPLAVSTAACGLFQGDQLGLDHPRANAKPTGLTVLVWGGSTSVGSQAIQLAVAAGYDVIATASPRNFDYVRSLGAAEVFDYNGPTVERDIIAALADRRFAGAVSLGATGAPACVRIAGAVQGNRFVSIATPPVTFETLADAGLGERARLTAKLIAANIRLQVAARRRGVRIKYIFGTSLKHNEVSTAIYCDFLPAALADDRYTIAPKATVVADGLDSIQAALDTHRRGVSAQKLVVRL